MRVSVNQRRIRVCAVLVMLFLFWQFIHGRFAIAPESFGLTLSGDQLWLGKLGLVAIAAWGLWRAVVAKQYD